MPKSYYIHTANGQSSIAELCDRDGTVIAEILPKGTEVHRQIVIDLLRYLVESMDTADDVSPEQIRADHAVHEHIRVHPHNESTNNAGELLNTHANHQSRFPDCHIWPCGT